MSRIELDDAQLDRGARVLDQAVTELAQATAKLATVQPHAGTSALTALSGSLLAAEVEGARGAAARAKAMAERQRVTLRRHAALTRIADGDQRPNDLALAIPFIQRPGMKQRPGWHKELAKLLRELDLTENPGVALAALERFLKNKQQAIVKDIQRIKSQGIKGERPKGLWGKLKSGVQRAWDAAKKQLSIIAKSVKAAVAGALSKLSAAASLAITAYQAITAPNGRERLKVLIEGAVSLVGGMLGALGGPAGAALGTALGAYIGEKLADQIIQDAEPPATAEPGL